MKKKPRQKPSFTDVDLSKPLKKSAIHVPENDCFGQVWDAYDKACQVCADSEVCCILFSDVVKKKVHEKELEAKNAGAAFLDTAEMLRNLEPFKAKLLKLIGVKNDTPDGVPVDEIKAYIMDKHNVSDEVAVVEWIKNFVKENGTICIKERKFRLRTQE